MRYWFYGIVILASLWSLISFGYGRGDGTPENPYHIYMVLWRGETEVESGFLDYFKERGIAVKATIRNLDRNRSMAETFIAEARALRPDLIYTWGTSGTLAMRGRYDLSVAEGKKFLTEIPGVFTLVAYPKEAGIIPATERTGRNLTGVLFLAPIEAQLGAMNNYLLPEKTLRRIGLIYNPLEKNSRINTEALARQARDLGIDLVIEAMPIITVTEDGRTYDKPHTAALPSLLEKISRSDVDFFYIGADSYMTRKIALLEPLVSEHKIPVFAATEAPIIAAQSPVLLSLTTAYYNLGKLTAFQAREILEGKLPRNIPVRSLRQFNLLLNRATMQKLEYFPPMNLLLNAEIIATHSNDEAS